MTPECAKVFMFKLIKYIMNGDVNKITNYCDWRFSCICCGKLKDLDLLFFFIFASTSFRDRMVVTSSGGL